MKNKICRLISDQRSISISLSIAAILFQTEGFCNDGSNKGLDEVSQNVSSFLFGSGVRKAALTLGLGGGLFQAFMSGSIRPLLIYGGLGLAVCYLPKVVDWISSI